MEQVILGRIIEIESVCDDKQSGRRNMGKKGKKAQAGKPKKLTPKDVGKRLDVLAKKVEGELQGC